MPKLLFNMHGAPDDEIQDVRELCEEHNFPVYELIQLIVYPQQLQINCFGQFIETHVLFFMSIRIVWNHVKGI